jgi:hypothetical protein
MGSLPQAGGVLDQNCVLMRQFKIILEVQSEKAEFDRKVEEGRQKRQASR